MAQVYANNARSTLAGSILVGATTLAIQAGDAAKFPNPAVGDFFLATITDPSLNREIVKCTARAGVTLTIVRGQEATTPFAFASGSNIDLRITAGTIANFLLGPGVAVTDNVALRADGTSGNNAQAAPIIMEDNGDITPLVNDVGALGSASKRWADVKLAIGATIDVGGDWVATHTAGKMAITTGGWANLGIVDTIDINGGTIDGTVVGGSVPAAVNGTTGTFTGVVTAGNGTAAAPAFKFASSQAGIYRTAADGGVGFSVVGAPKGAFHATGFSVSDQAAADALINPNGVVLGVSLSSVGALSSYLNTGSNLTAGRGNSGVVLNCIRGGVSKGTIDMDSLGVGYNSASDESWKWFLGLYDGVEAIRIILADPVREYTWRESKEFDIGWGAQTSYAVASRLATPGGWKDPITDEGWTEGAVRWIDPRTLEPWEEGGVRWIDPITHQAWHEGGARLVYEDSTPADEDEPVVESAEGEEPAPPRNRFRVDAVAIAALRVEAIYRPWAMDMSRRVPYLWAAVPFLLNKIETLEQRLADIEKRLTAAGF